MKYLRLLALTLFTLLAACATVNNYSVIVDSWHGANVRELYRVWGYPNEVTDLPGGHKVLVYSYRVRGRQPVYSTPGYSSVSSQNGQIYSTRIPTTVSDTAYYDYHCTTWFEINRRGIIIGTSFRGNFCSETRGAISGRSRPASLALPVAQPPVLKNKTQKVQKKSVAKIEKKPGVAQENSWRPIVTTNAQVKSSKKTAVKVQSQQNKKMARKTQTKKAVAKVQNQQNTNTATKSQNQQNANTATKSQNQPNSNMTTKSDVQKKQQLQKTLKEIKGNSSQ